MLTTKAGSGICLVNVLGSAFSPALIRLFGNRDEVVFDYLSFRRDLEGLAVERAGRLGSDSDLRVVQAILYKMKAAYARNAAEEEGHLYAQLHMANFEANQT